MAEAVDRTAHVAAVVAAVMRQAVRDAGAEGMLLRDDGSPEARLVREWCGDVLVTGERDNVLAAHPANKTALLLGVSVPFTRLLPLGDLYASQVEALAGGWTAPLIVHALADRAGGVTVLDRALSALVDERRDARAALTPLPAAVRPDVLAAFERGRFARGHIGLVPKLGARTLGIDLFA